MKQLRIWDGQNLLFDASKEVLDGRVGKGKIMIKMKNGPLSYETPTGTKFWRKHPYQWVSKEEAVGLTSLNDPEFVIVSREDAEDYYLE